MRKVYLGILATDLFGDADHLSGQLAMPEINRDQYLLERHCSPPKVSVRRAGASS